MGGCRGSAHRYLDDHGKHIFITQEHLFKNSNTRIILFCAFFVDTAFVDLHSKKRTRYCTIAEARILSNSSKRINMHSTKVVAALGSLILFCAPSVHASGGTWPKTYTSCGVNHTLSGSPSRVVTMNQGVTEFMLAMGLADKIVGTAYLDDSIWPRYAAAYNKIPVLSSSYPDENTIMEVNPDFIVGSYRSAFRERTCDEEGKCRGIFTNATGVGPCDGEGSDFFSLGSNETVSYSTCRPQLHALNIGTWLEPVSCEDSTLRPQEGATEETVYAAVRQIGRIFDEPQLAEYLVSEIRHDFAIAEHTVKGLEKPLKTVWLDCVDCCEIKSGEKGLFVGAGTGAPNLIMKEAGMTNAFADTSGSWACVSADDILAAKPEVMVVVDASWDSALSKVDYLHNHSKFCGAEFVQRADYITIPFSASTLGPRNGVAALDMVTASLHVMTGSPKIDFKSGVKFFDPVELVKQTAELRCPIDASKVKYSDSYIPDTPANSKEKEFPVAAIAAIAILGSIAIASGVMFVIIYKRETAGDPLFQPILKEIEQEP